MDVSPIAQNIQDTITDQMMLQREDQSVDASVLSRRWEQNTYERQSVEQILKERPSRVCPTWDLSYIESPNPDTNADTKKFLLTGAWYYCLLRGSDKACQTPQWMLIDNHWVEHGFPNGRDKERTEGTEGVCNPIGRIISTNQNPQNSQGLNNQTKSTHGVTHGSNWIWSRR